MKIVIADDQDSMLKMYALMLSDYDMEIIEAKTGKDAVEIATEQRPELIILDHMMPEMTGYEAIQRLRSHPNTSHTAILFITGKDFDDTMRKMIKLDVQDFISKPFTADSLIAAIEKAVKHPLLQANGNRHFNMAKKMEIIEKVKDDTLPPMPAVKPAVETPPVEAKKPEPVALDHALSAEHKRPHLEPETPPIPLPPPPPVVVKPPEPPPYLAELRIGLEKQTRALERLKTEIEDLAHTTEAQRSTLERMLGEIGSTVQASLQSQFVRIDSLKDEIERQAEALEALKEQLPKS